MEKPEVLFHGGPHRCPVLEPCQATDVNRVPANTLAGVYATANRQVAMCYCLDIVQGEDPCTYCRIEFTEAGPRFVYVLGRPNLGGKGYLHILPAATFTFVSGALGENDQWVSTGPVRALAIEEVLVDEHPELWRYASPEERQQVLELRARLLAERSRDQEAANKGVQPRR